MCKLSRINLTTIFNKLIIKFFTNLLHPRDHHCFPSEKTS